MGKHKVKKGETLSKIAKSYGLSLQELLDLNGISADKANHITIGQELVTDKNMGLPDFSKSFKLSGFTPYESSTAEAVIPYTPRSKEENDTILLQRQLQAKGYDLGKYGVDGKMGKATKAALQQAMADGLVYKNGELVFKEYKSSVPKESGSSVPMYGVHPQFGFNIPQSQKVSSELPDFKSIPTEQLQKIYTEGPGYEQALGTGVYHVLAPESWSTPHTGGLKNQVAAAIAYNESLPTSKREKDSNGIQTDEDGYQYIGYNTYGILSGQSGNVNEQGTDGNGASKIMGGLRYRINDDGSVHIKDAYGFNVIRDFNKLNSKGKVRVLTKEETKSDPYIGSPWKGLWHDLNSEHFSFTEQGLQDLGENFGTRQRKVRDNSFTFKPGEISQRLTKPI